MPRPRGQDLPHQQPHRVPLLLKTSSSSQANRVRQLVVDRSLNLEDARCPRSSLQERKRDTRVEDLETRLSKAEEELKKLREQLSSAEVAKIDDKQSLPSSKKQDFAVTRTPQVDQESLPLPLELERPSEANSEVDTISSPTATDVIEGVEQPKEDEEEEVEKMKDEGDTETMTENAGDNHIEGAAEQKVDEKSERIELAESPEVVEIKAMILERDKEVEILLEENMIFKRRAKEEAEKIAASGRAREEALNAKLGSMESELKESMARTAQLMQQLEVAERAKAKLEAEMKRQRVQAEQWRKAAEAAVTLLATADEPGKEMGVRRVSMDKHLGVGYVGWGSPLVASEMEEDGVVGVRRKAAGIRMFGDLWKKKVQQKQAELVAGKE